jgi:hypothetical protein
MTFSTPFHDSRPNPSIFSNTYLHIQFYIIKLGWWGLARYWGDQKGKKFFYLVVSTEQCLRKYECHHTCKEWAGGRGHGGCEQCCGDQVVAAVSSVWM